MSIHSMHPSDPEGFDWGDGTDVGWRLAIGILDTNGPCTIEVDLSNTTPARRAKFLLGMAATLRAATVMEPGLRAQGLVPFNPDWTVAPAATLREVMASQGYTVDSLAAAIAGMAPGWRSKQAVAGMLAALLDRQPMDEGLATALEGVTGIKATMWQGLEDQYRADLAAGRKDTTPTTETEQQ